jgi:hypothetical protein
MGAVAPLHLPLIDQAHIGFVNECSGLQGMPCPLALHVARRHPAQVVVDEWHEVFERLRAPVAPGDQQLRNGRSTVRVVRHLVS